MSDTACRVAVTVMIAVMFDRSCLSGVLVSEWSCDVDAQGAIAVTCMCETKDGGFAVALGTAQQGDVPNQIILIKGDRSGKQEWQRAYGREGNIVPRSIVQTADGGYMIAGFGIGRLYGAGRVPGKLLEKRDGVYLIRCGNNGDRLWDCALDVGRCFPFRVVETEDGGYVVAGILVVRSAEDVACIGRQSPEETGVDTKPLLVAIDHYGKIVWQRVLDNRSDWRARWLELADEGGLVLGGSVEGKLGVVKLDRDGKELWSVIWDDILASAPGMVRLCRRSIGGFVVGYHARVILGGETGLLPSVCVVDGEGRKGWSRCIRGDWLGQLRTFVEFALFTNSSGEYVVCWACMKKDGGSVGGDNICAARLNEGGEVLSVSRVELPGNQIVCSIVQTKDDGLFVVGFRKVEDAGYSLPCVNRFRPGEGR